MKVSFGVVAGLGFALIATAAGLYAALYGIGTGPKTGLELGLFFGVGGAAVGLTCSALGIALHRGRAP